MLYVHITSQPDGDEVVVTANEICATEYLSIWEVCVSVLGSGGGLEGMCFFLDVFIMECVWAG